MLQNRINKRIVLFAVLVLACISFAIYSTYILNIKSFYKGIHLDGHDLSEMSYQKARLLLHDRLRKNYEGKEFEIKYGNNSWKFDTKDISLQPDTDEALDHAFNIGRSGNVFNRLSQIISVRFNTIDIQPVLNYNTDKVKNLLETIKKQIDQEEKNASITYKNGTILVEKDVIGRNMPVDKNLELIENRIIDRQFGSMELYVEEKVPRITYNDIKDIQGVLSVFKTSFNPKDENRNHNIKLGCERLNSMILMPNDIFSMNQALGPRTLENGYREAPVIFKNELVPGTGGGVCQITSTLYNAVLLSKLDVLQRTHHSWPLGYIDPGRDATIAEDYIDFKFQNSTGAPIGINAEIAGNTLFIRILGKIDEQKQIVKLKSEVLEEYPAEGEEVVIDNSIPDNEKVISREAKKGLKVVVYRETYSKSGELIDKEKISEDIYKPVKAQVKVNENYIKR
ncbi:MAG: VanW family protein [Clostridia bacterium]|nr:VanW family protein [Clostridia bacterium]